MVAILSLPQCVNSLWPSDAMGSDINIAWVDGLVPDGTKPLPETMLTCNQEDHLELLEKSSN